ncbi:MAG: N,N'-diacetylchitobiose phosphorylase, partial [Treponema sp.]|nr:N,N'-diacetylchitobiose phosphorylase [Treponema sp.]
RECMKTVKEKLATPYGLMLCAPPFEKASRSIMSSVVYNAGIKENAGIFNHTQGWGVIAETLMANGDRAYEYSKASIPPAYNDKAEIRQSEPYVVGQTTYSTFSPRAGNTRVSWLSGAATWNYYSITQYILGIRPQYDALLLDPCVPTKWDGFKVERRWRGMNLEIEVKNPQHVSKGIEYIEVDGKRLDSATIPVADLKNGSKIVAVMGKDAKVHEWQRL